MKGALAILVLIVLSSFRAENDIGQWSFSFDEPLKKGFEVSLIFNVSLKKNWYLYSSDLSVDVGPIPTQIEFLQDSSFQRVGDIVPLNPLKKVDKTWDATVTYFEQQGKFKQRIKVLAEKPIIKGTIIGQYCSEKNGQCIPFKQAFEF
jgi:hypothetical protein